MRTTLDEVRDRYRRAAAGLPPVERPDPPEPVAAKMRRAAPAAPAPPASSAPWGARKSPRYTLTTERDDAILAFSAHKGKKISELAQTEEGRNFLGWIARQPFPDWPSIERSELQTLARAYLGRLSLED